MAYKELIKSFDRIREYMRQFYVYGFRSRSEFDAKSARSYDNERRRIDSWLHDYMRFHQDASGRRFFLSIDSREAAQNPLYAAFRAKSFTDNDITLHFLLLDTLADGQAHSLRALLDALADAGMKDLDESTVRKKLREYMDMGLVCGEKSGRDMAYRLPQETEDLAAWRDAAAFYAEASPLGVAGSYLLSRMPQEETPFCFKHHYILHALDSEVLLALLELIAGQRGAKVTVHSSRRGAQVERYIVPLSIRESVQGGRRYLYGYDVRRKRFTCSRIDGILSVEDGGPVAAYEKVRAAGEAFAARMWGASTGAHPDETAAPSAAEHVEMVICAAEGEDFIRQRLERERRCGQVEAIDALRTRFTADVVDALELLPWIRTFTGRIESLTSSNPELERRFAQDLAAMERLYGEGGGEHAVL
ncbi:MAG: WYL domain-containing protein [Clostridia bacterium]|nr:WYL domain-containing protein [Clostridia bacterium]